MYKIKQSKESHSGTSNMVSGFTGLLIGSAAGALTMFFLARAQAQNQGCKFAQKVLNYAIRLLTCSMM